MGYLTLMAQDAPQRVYPLREIFNALRYLIRASGAWRMLPNDLPPWHMVYQQTQRWIKAGCFEAMAHDLRVILRLKLERKADPSAVIMDSRTVQSTPESGARAGYDGHKKRKKRRQERLKYPYRGRKSPKIQSAVEDRRPHFTKRREARRRGAAKKYEKGDFIAFSMGLKRCCKALDRSIEVEPGRATDRSTRGACPSGREWHGQDS